MDHESLSGLNYTTFVVDTPIALGGQFARTAIEQAAQHFDPDDPHLHIEMFNGPGRRHGQLIYSQISSRSAYHLSEFAQNSSVWYWTIMSCFVDNLHQHSRMQPVDLDMDIHIVLLGYVSDVHSGFIAMQNMLQPGVTEDDVLSPAFAIVVTPRGEAPPEEELQVAWSISICNFESVA